MYIALEKSIFWGLVRVSHEEVSLQVEPLKSEVLKTTIRRGRQEWGFWKNLIGYRTKQVTRPTVPISLIVVPEIRKSKLKLS